MTKYLETVSGRLAPRAEVRNIKGQYYHYDELVKIKNTYHRKNNGKVIYDLDEGVWKLSADVEGKILCVLDIIDGKEVLGASIRPFEYTLDDSGIYVKNLEVAYILGYRYFGQEKYQLSKIARGRGRDRNARRYPYGFTPDEGLHRKIIKNKIPVTPKFTPEKNQFFDELFSKYSIGVEIETSRGYLLDHETYLYQMFPLRDGSIENTEFCTAPIRSAEDFYRLMMFMDVKFAVDHRCSMHVHVGGLSRDDISVMTAFYYLCYRIQHELHSCVPSYRKNLERQKDYGKYLKGFGLEYTKDIDPETMFPVIYRFLTGGREFVDLDEPHPQDGNAKWNYAMRYYYVNMINYLFNGSGTVEFRLFPSVQYFDILFVWVSLCLMIVEYADKNVQKILGNRDKINLEEIIFDSTWPNDLKELILEYVRAFQKISYDETIYQKETFDNYMDEYSELSVVKRMKLLECLRGTEEKATVGKGNAQSELERLLRA